MAALQLFFGGKHIGGADDLASLRDKGKLRSTLDEHRGSDALPKALALAVAEAGQQVCSTWSIHMGQSIPGFLIACPSAMGSLRRCNQIVMKTSRHATKCTNLSRRDSRLHSTGNYHKSKKGTACRMPWEVYIFIQYILPNPKLRCSATDPLWQTSDLQPSLS